MPRLAKRQFMRRKFPATTPQRRHAYNHRLQGIAAALGELAGAHMEPDLAAMVLDSLGLTIADL